MLVTLDLDTLSRACGGFQWEHFRPSTNVEDHRGRYSASEDGTLYDNYTGRTIADPTVNQDLGGWRDDPVTGNRTWIGPDGDSDSVERPDGSITRAPSVWDETARNTPSGPPNDFNFGDFSSAPGGNEPSGEDWGSGGFDDSASASGGFDGGGESDGGFEGGGFVDGV